MESIELSFKILSVFGIWRPKAYSTKLNKLFYFLYSSIVVPLPYILDIGLILRLLLVELNFDEMSETFFMFLATTGICCKSMNFQLQRKQVINLLNMLSSNYAQFKTDDSLELIIRDRYNKFIRYITLTLIVMVEVTVVAWLSIPFFQTTNHRTLPYKIWLPYNNTMDRIYWITYVPTSMSIISVSFIASANDAIFSGFIMAVCGQFDLLSHRIVSIPKYIGESFENYKELHERRLIGQSIRHHHFILKFADSFREAFSFVILTQFIISSIVISMSAYRLSVSESINIDFFSKLLFLNCLLVEFFLYCWFGNKLLVKSQEFGDSIFNIDWTTVSNKSKKMLLIIALRATKPIVMSCGHFIVLSLDSYTQIIKVSYTVFNVLQTTSN